MINSILVVIHYHDGEMGFWPVNSIDEADHIMLNAFSNPAVSDCYIQPIN